MKKKICFGSVMVNFDPKNNYQVHLVEIFPNKASGQKQLDFSGTPDEVRTFMKEYMIKNNLFSHSLYEVNGLYKNKSNGNGFYGWTGCRHTLRYKKEKQ
jgi:hypothetical protein